MFVLGSKERSTSFVIPGSANVSIDPILDTSDFAGGGTDIETGGSLPAGGLVGNWVGGRVGGSIGNLVGL